LRRRVVDYESKSFIPDHIIKVIYSLRAKRGKKGEQEKRKSHRILSESEKWQMAGENFLWRGGKRRWG